jgi:hypothetical protein
MEQFDYLPLATQRASFNGLEAAAYGSLIISSNTAKATSNFSSIINMRVGVGFVQDAGSYNLPYQVDIF